MANSYSSLYYHIVFSTRERFPALNKEIRRQLFPYLGGIAREHQMKLEAIGGMPDHIHCLVMIPATVTLSKSVQVLKGISSKWMHITFPELSNFAWQDGYAAFTVSKSNISKVLQYIESQEEHHKKEIVSGRVHRLLKSA